MEVAYNPDELWELGRHILRTEMCWRHRNAVQALRATEEVTAPFRGDLYSRTGDLWAETVAQFRSRLTSTDLNMDLLGQAVERYLLDQLENEQLQIANLSTIAYRTEMLDPTDTNPRDRSSNPDPIDEELE